MADDFWELEESTDLVEQEESEDVIILEEGEGVVSGVTTPSIRIMNVTLTWDSCDSISSFKNVVKEKTSNSVLDFKFDWKSLTNGSGNQNWLDDDETITSVILTTPSGITSDSGTISDTKTSILFWLSGGSLKNYYDITCAIETNLGRKETATMTIRMVEKKSG